jgi:hypothetical protein
MSFPADVCFNDKGQVYVPVPPFGVEVDVSEEAVMQAYVSTHVHLRDLMIAQAHARCVRSDSYKAYCRAQLCHADDVGEKQVAWACAVDAEMKFDYAVAVLERFYEFAGGQSPNLTTTAEEVDRACAAPLVVKYMAAIELVVHSAFDELIALAAGETAQQ